MLDLDQLLSLCVRVAWVLFAIYIALIFIQSLIHEGLIIALFRLVSRQVFFPLLIPIALGLLSAAVIFVNPTQVAVVISLISPGGVRPQPQRAGLHLIIPVLEYEKMYPLAWQTYTMAGKPNEGAKAGDDSIRARTSDGQEIRLDLSIIFRINYEQVVALHADWQDRYIEDFVRPVIRSLVRTQVSQFTVKEVNSSARKDLEATLDRLITAELAAKGLNVDQFLLRDITFTSEYAAAIERKQVALEDEERTLHEAQQMRNLAQGTRDQAKTVAEGEAEAIRIKTKAQSEAEAAGILVKANAQAEALRLISVPLTQDPSLITYEYVQKLSPNIRAMLLPSNAPLLLPMNDLLALENKNLTTTIMPTTTVALTSSILPTSTISTTVTPASVDKK